MESPPSDPATGTFRLRVRLGLSAQRRYGRRRHDPSSFKVEQQRRREAPEEKIEAVIEPVAGPEIANRLLDSLPIAANRRLALRNGPATPGTGFLPPTLWHGS